MTDKILLYFSGIVLIAALCGCKDDFNPDGTLQPSSEVHYLRPSKAVFESSLPDAFRDSLTVESIGVNWAFASMPVWISASPAEGTQTAEVTLNAGRNGDAHAGRTAVFYLQSADPAWESSSVLTLTQGAAAPELTVSETALTLPGSATTASVKITANCDWTAYCAQEWVTLSPDLTSGELAISVTANVQSSYRSASVALNYGSKSEVVEITQMPAGISTSALELSYYNYASAYDLEIEAEADWKTSVSGSWITVSPSEGKAGKSVVKVEVAPNGGVDERTGYVAFYTGTHERLQVKVTQKGIYIEADGTLELDAEGTPVTLNIKSNTSWKILSSPAWLNLSVKEGSGDTAVTVSGSLNDTNAPLMGEIVVGWPGISSEARVSVKQFGRYIEVGSAFVSFDSTGGLHNVELSSNDDWALSKPEMENWLTVSPTSGTGNAVVAMKAGDNATLKKRSAVVSISGKRAKDVALSVEQQGRYLRVSERNVMFFASGGESDPITVESDGTYTIDKNASWFRIEETAKGVYKVIAEPNGTGTIRRGEIIFTMTGLKEGEYRLTLPVVQASEGGSFIITGFDEDVDWDTASTNSMTVTVKGYTSDSNWDTASSGSVSVTIKGYGADEDWN